ncbi:MAG: MBL fold metallo-hydrolase [Candidatus Thermoplasmatota archaeon]
MKVTPLSSDSLGVRSMATLIETSDCKILIDPSAALGPYRYGLPPHEIEIDTLYKTKERISRIAETCDILVISHYHYDHYDPEKDFYRDKKVYAKDITSNINKSQLERGREFKDRFKDKCEIIYCDDTRHMIGDTNIIFSPPFHHGPKDSSLGYILMTIVEEERKILHASDVQGPVTKDATDYIIKQRPDLLIIDGPPTIFLGWKFSQKNLDEASDNMLRIIENLECDIILDHHLLRDIKYKEHFPAPYKKGGGRVKTFAEYLGLKNNTLEAYRKELWAKNRHQ